MKDLVQLGDIKHRITVCPDSDRASGSENTLCLCEECFRVQPVKGLSYRYEID